jgi:glycosyltransferase involved in cell wall biosynthesis
MKILQVLNHYLPHQVAGTEIYTHLLSQYLTLSGEEVKVVIPAYNSTQTTSYDYEGISIICYAEPSEVDRELIMGHRKPEGLISFEEVLNAESPDIVHFHELAGSNGITLHHVESAKKMGFKVVMTFHLAGNSCKAGTLMYKNESLCDGVIDIDKCTSCIYKIRGLSEKKTNLIFPIAKALYKLGIDFSKQNHTMATALGFPFLIKQIKNNLIRLSYSCDRFVVVAKWYKDILEINGVNPNKIVSISQVLPQFVDESIINEYQIPELPVKMVFVGRISAFKGLDILISTLKDIPVDSITLDIYGYDPFDEYSNDCKKQSSLMENVRWRGALKPGTVVQTLRSYHLLCLPSTFSEMSPLVIQEAFAAGIPVVASDVYGNAEQIQHNYNGLLFKFKDSKSLKSELEKIIKSPSILKELNSNIKPPLTFDKVGLAYAELYNELIS